MRRLLALASALTASGCAAGAPALRASAPGAERWSTFTTSHVELWTAAEPAAARALAARLERVHLTLAAVLAGPRPPPGRLRVVLLPGRTGPAGLGGTHVAALLTTRAEEPTAVAAADRALADPTLLAHELAHHLVERLLVSPPRWLDEGLAEALEAAGDPAAPPGTIGAWPRWAHAGWRPAPGFVRRLLAWDGAVDPVAPRREAEAAWLLARLLLEEEPARLAAWLRRLEAGQPARRAWGATFPEWDEGRFLGPDRLEARALAFLEARASAHRAAPVAAWPAGLKGQVEREVEVVARAASPADVRLVLLELPRRERRTPEALRAEVVAVLGEAPDHPAALRWLAQLDRLPPLPLARQAVEAHPGDWRAWAFLASALRSEGVEPAAREEALRLAGELAPGQVAPLRALAAHLAEAGRSGEALPVAWRALALRPWDPAVLDLYAAAAVGVGACPVAPEAASRVAGLLAALPSAPQAGDERLARAGDLARLERRCDLARFAETAFSTLEARAEAAHGQGVARGRRGAIREWTPGVDYRRRWAHPDGR
jgi:tetratricopeptide (TPR) repeat protein